MHNLAECYRYGEGVRRRNSSAIELYERAAGRGLVQAQRDLGTALLDGRLGVSPDAKRASVWLKKAAEQGDRVACSRLGLAYAQGAGNLERDDDKAERYLVKAAQGYKEVLSCLAQTFSALIHAYPRPHPSAQSLIVIGSSRNLRR